MFKKFFGKEEDDEEVVYETVDPVLEQRRKEKFSAPLIYNDEAEKNEEVVDEKKKVVPVTKTSVSVEPTYRMSEIISPITGVKKSAQTETKIAKPKKHKPRKESDELIPIISPFYGPADNNEKEEDVLETVQVQTVHVDEDVTVENNLRNIASIVAEEKDQLKIIEERTGEFKLDFQDEKEESFIDEIDDSMSLDELMNLYEKKFKD